MGARAGAIDFVSQKHIAKNRALPELPRAILRIVKTAAGDVGGQQIGRELHAAKSAFDGTRQAFGERGFAGSGRVFEQGVAAGEQRDEQ